MKIARRRLLGLVAGSLVLGGAAKAQKAQDVIRVGTDATFPPFEYSENGKRIGFDVELIEAIGKQLGKTVEWTDIDFKGLVPGLIANRFDVAASAIYITDERRKVVDFTDPYYPGGLVIMMKKGDDRIKGPDDLDGKKVSVQVGTKSVNFLKDKFPDGRAHRGREEPGNVPAGRDRPRRRRRHRQAGGQGLCQGARHAAGGRPAADGRGVRLRACARTIRNCSSSSTTR